jgi:hypothetical protein
MRTSEARMIGSSRFRSPSRFDELTIVVVEGHDDARREGKDSGCPLSRLCAAILTPFVGILINDRDEDLLSCLKLV